MNKGKALFISFIVLLCSIATGYLATGFLSSKKDNDKVKPVIPKVEIEDKIKYDDVVYKLDFTNTTEVISKINNNIGVSIINNQVIVKRGKLSFNIKSIINPISVKMEYYEKDSYHNIYVLNKNGELFRFKDIDLLKVKNNHYELVITKLNVKDIKFIASLNNFNISSTDIYPSIYAKDNLNNIYVSEFDSELVELNEAINNPKSIKGVVNIDYTNKTEVTFDDVGAGNSISTRIDKNILVINKSGYNYKFSDMINPISIRIIGSKNRNGYHIIYILTKDGTLYSLSDENNFEKEATLIEGLSNIKEIATVNDHFYTNDIDTIDLYVKTNDNKIYTIINNKFYEY